MAENKVLVRYPQIRDAERFYEIINNPNFIYISIKVESVEAERKWIRQRLICRKMNIEWNYAILYNGELVGGIGIRINPYRNYVGEIGYFIDEKYWGMGIATKAVKLVEKIGFRKLGLSRIEILMQPENKASEKVAFKSGYWKEGLLRGIFIGRDGGKKDALIYAKIKKD